MKSVGILTFQKSLNHGSALQAFALERQLLNLGFDAHVIDYEQRAYQQKYGFFSTPVSKADLRADLVHLQYAKICRRRIQDFEAFREQKLHLSKPALRFGDDLSSLSERFDAIICGSDQIWNPNASDFDLNYFLPSTTGVQKLSYAVSINGGDLRRLPEAEQIHAWLQDFDQLSVREQTGKQNLDGFLGGAKPVRVDPDPTLLHDAALYDSVALPQLIDEPYVFFYSINFRADAVTAAETIGCRLGLPVYTFFAGRGTSQFARAGKKLHIWAGAQGPDAFLSLIRHAAFVVTNSFHGTAFSLIFGKKFVSVASVNPDGTVRYDERIVDGLREVGQEDRFVTAEQCVDFPLESEPDLALIHARRAELAADAESYLREALSK